MSDDLSYLASATDAAASGNSSLYDKAKSSLAKGVAAAGVAGAAVAGAAVAFPAGAIALGAALGSTVPVIGTAIGAVVGTLVALFEVFGKNPHPGIDDGYWDTLGYEGIKTHEPNGLDISTAQIALVHRFAQGVVSQPNWQQRWPTFWNNIAGNYPGNNKNPNSPLLANAVARYLGAPEQGKPMVDPGQAAFAQLKATVAANAAKAAFAKVQAQLDALNALKAAQAAKTNAALASMKLAAAKPPTPAGPAMNLTGLNLSGVSGFGGLGSWNITRPAGAPPLTLLPSPHTTTISLQQIATAAATGQGIPIQPVHAIVAANAQGDPAAQTAVLNAVSAARGPAPTPAQTQLAEALTLAHKIQTHAKYVQKWFGPAVAQQVLAGHYMTLSNLGG